MKRSLIVVVPLVLISVLAAASLMPYLNRPSDLDFRLARGRALLDAQDYLGALGILRDLPVGQANRAETHSYLGAAYFRLHLYQAAIKEFEAAIGQGARRSDPWIGLASTYLQLGDPAKALEQAKKATDTETRSAEAWLMLGRAHWMQREFAEAEKAGLEALELDPKNPVTTELLLHVYFDQNQADKFQALLDRTAQPSKPIQDLAVRFYVRQGQFARAYELKNRFERAALERSILQTELQLQREPGRFDLYPLLIKNMIRVGRYTDAIDYGSRYRGTVPIDFELGKAYSMAGQKERAIQSYRRASGQLVHKLSAEIAMAAMTTTAGEEVQNWRQAYTAERPEQDYFILARLDGRLESNPAASPVVRAFIYRYAGLFDNEYYNKAAEEALKALDADPKSIDALFTIATAYQRLGRIDDAERYTGQAAEFYPDNAEAWSRLGNVAMAKNEAAKVADLMERAVRLQPNHAGYLYNFGWMYDQTGDTAQATSYYQRAIRSSPLSFEAMNNLALIYSAAGQPELALPLLRQAILTDPESEAAYFNMANYYVRQREWKIALDNFQRVLDLNPASALAAVEKGRILLDLGRTEEAIETFNYALEFDAGAFDAYILLSSAYEKMDHSREAIAAAEEARRIRADAPEVKAALQRLNPQKESNQ